MEPVDLLAAWLPYWIQGGVEFDRSVAIGGDGHDRALIP